MFAVRRPSSCAWRVQSPELPSETATSTLRVVIDADFARAPPHDEEHREVRLFGAVDHWDTEALGWSVTKRDDCYAMVDAAAMAVRSVFGPIKASAAHGVAPRGDRGSRFVAEHFQDAGRLVAREPERRGRRRARNGVAERIFHILKERTVHGRLHHSINEVPGVAPTSVVPYSSAWRLGKSRIQDPGDAKIASNQDVMKRAA